MGRGICALLSLAAIGLPSVRAEDFVFLAESRPVLVRLNVRVDGKSVEAAWEAFIKHVFAELDVNKDGWLNKEEVERVPSAAQVLSGGLAQAFGGGGDGPSMETLDTNKDGKVTLAELGAYYRKNGLAPFQMQLGPPAQNPLAQAQAALGGGRGEPTAEAVTEAIFKLLDTNKDGKLSRAELAAAPAVLLRLDEDDDEIITPRELVPDAKPNVNVFGGMMAGPGAGGASSKNKLLIPLAKPGETPAELVKAMQERYGPKADKPEEKKLSRKDLGLDEATFSKLDTNHDGVLDAKELAAFVTKKPDLELTMRLGTRGEKEAKVELMAGDARTREALAMFNLGATRLDLRNGDRGGYDDAANPYGGIIRQQVTVQFKQADTDGNGYLDAKEAQASRAFKGMFKALDRDGDGKVTEAELNAYMDRMEDLRTRAEAACVALVFSDQSRGLFDVLDTNRDGRLTVREVRGAAKLIDELGRTAQGHLTKADIPRTYQITLRRGPAEAGGANQINQVLALYRGMNRNDADPPPADGPLWFRRMDRNRDGDVSRKEWLFSDAQFRRIDTDGDGLISAEEARKATPPGSEEKGR